MTAGDEIGFYSELARKIALRYKRRAPWVCVADLEQEAWLAFLDAAPRFDPNVGVPKWKFLERAGTYACAKIMHRSRSPISGSCTESLDAATSVDFDLEVLPGDVEIVETYADKQWGARVRGRLQVILSDCQDGDLAEPVILGQKTPKEVANSFGVAVQKVYTACRKVRKDVQQSPELYTLARDKLRG